MLIADNMNYVYFIQNICVSVMKQFPWLCKKADINNNWDKYWLLLQITSFFVFITILFVSSPQSGTWEPGGGDGVGVFALKKKIILEGIFVLSHPELPLKMSKVWSRIVHPPTLETFLWHCPFEPPPGNEHIKYTLCRPYPFNP